jgi:hypothetical protein
LVVVAMLPTSDDRRDIDRRARAIVMLALAVGVLVSVTLCASPKLGSRFYIAPLAGLLASFIALVDARVRAPRWLAALVALAVIASGVAARCTVPLFRTVAAESAARMAALEASTPGDAFVAERWTQVGESWWFIGDDFRDAQKCAMVAHYFGLARVSLRSKH